MLIPIFLHRSDPSARLSDVERLYFVSQAIDASVDAIAADLCVTAAQLVAAGRAEYDASAEEGCLAAHQRSHDACVPDWDEIVASRREVWSACRVVKGTVRPGGSCTSASMCA